MGNMRPGFGRGPMQRRGFDKPKDVRAVLLRILSYFKPHWKSIAGLLVLVLFTNAATAINPAFIGKGVDIVRGMVGTGESLPALFFWVVGGMLVIAVSNSAFGYLINVVLARISAKIVYVMRGELFGKLQNLPLRFFDSHEKGDLMSRLTNDVETVSTAISQGIGNVVGGLLELTFTTVFILILNWRLALVAMAFIPVVLVLTFFTMRKSKKYFRNSQRYLGDVNGFIEEIVTAQHVVKVFGREEEETARFNERNDRYMHTTIRAQALSGVLFPSMNMINNISFVMLAVAGGVFIVNGHATVGELAAFFNYARNYGRPLANLSQQIVALQSAFAGAERVFQTMDELAEPADAPDAKEFAFRGAVDFRDVNFSYVPGVPVLQDVNVTVKPGQTIALVGPTGAGKTTIINLLTRFYDLDGGSISIDGVDIRDIKKDCLRKQLGIVLQDTYLFADTVRENIRYGRLGATDDEVRAAAKLASAHSFIRRLPNRYDTVLAEEGGNLSQGQRQLLAITRAILADPAILILDEATSSVDTRTEILIQNAMLKLMQGRTSFVIAHRLSTILHADLILVVRDGRIVERGRHEELLEQKGFYHSLYMSQYGGVAAQG